MVECFKQLAARRRATRTQISQGLGPVVAARYGVVKRLSASTVVGPSLAGVGRI